MPVSPPIKGLYVHIPFCDGKCRYCAFYSVPYNVHQASAWLRAVQDELQQAVREFGPLRPNTVFFGGGTPTLLPPDQLTALCEMICSLVDLAECVEWTVEANPGTLDARRLGMLKAYGVNRISLGVQSLDDRVLRDLGRRHTVRDALVAVEGIVDAGFSNWSLDLIACVPGVSVDCWARAVDAAVSLGPMHVSVYALTAEEGTKLARDLDAGSIWLQDDDEQLLMLDTARERLEKAGFSQYEISNYARPGQACRHNLSCWRGENYIGLGCAASSRVGLKRWTNHSDLNGYLAGSPAGIPREVERLSPITDAVERVVFGLRMTAGVDVEAILSVTGTALEPQAAVWRKTLTRLNQEGLLWLNEGRWCLTSRGRALADYVAVELMP